MRSKSISFLTSTLTLALVFTLMTVARAAGVTGLVYGFGFFTQNGSASTAYIGESVTGNACSGQAFIALYGVNIKLLQGATATFNSASDVDVTGAGTYATGSGATYQTVPGVFHLHVWQGIVGGVNGSWLQSEFTGSDGSVLFGSGPPTPGAASAPVKLLTTILRAPTP